MGLLTGPIAIALTFSSRTGKRAERSSCSSLSRGSLDRATMGLMGPERTMSTGSSASKRTGTADSSQGRKKAEAEGEPATRRKPTAVKLHREPLPPNSLATVKGEALDAAVGIPLGRDLGPMQLRNASVRIQLPSKV